MHLNIHVLAGGIRQRLADHIAALTILTTGTLAGSYYSLCFHQDLRMHPHFILRPFVFINFWGYTCISPLVQRSASRCGPPVPVA
jgi:hypothetical protein